MKNGRNLLIGAATFAFIIAFASAAHAGASSAGAGDGDPSGRPGIYGTSPSPAANPDSPGAGPHSGPTNNRINPVTGQYTPYELGTFNPNYANTNYAMPQRVNAARIYRTCPASTYWNHGYCTDNSYTQ